MTSVMEEPTLQVDSRRVGISFEAKLIEWNVPYEYVPDFPLADLKNPEWAQVRESASLADHDSQAEYRTQMAQGAVFPPIVVMSPDVLVDGNHRVLGAKGLRRKTFPAFVARFNSVDLAKSFAAAINQSNGRRLTNPEAYEAALTMMQRGMDDSAIALNIGRSPEQVRTMRRQREFDTRAAEIPDLKYHAEKVPAAQRAKLSQIKHTPAFVEAVKLVSEAKPTAKMITELVQAVANGRTDTEEIEAVRQVRADLAPAGPPPIRVTIPRELHQARMHLGGLIKLSTRPQALLDIANDRSRAMSIENWKVVRELADKVLAAYGED